MITRPVTYWDRLGWQDTLARAENTRLQRAYAKHDLPNSGVYTPQMILDGRVGVIGSRQAQVRKLIEQRQRNAEHCTIGAKRVGTRQVQVTVSSSPEADYVVKLVALIPKRTVRIGNGENGGRTIDYFNVVKDEELTNIPDGADTIMLDLSGVAAASRYAVVIQDGFSGEAACSRYLPPQ